MEPLLGSLEQNVLWAMEPLHLQRRQMAYESLQQMKFDAGTAMDAARAGLPVQIIGSTAVIPLHGMMMRRPNVFDRFFGAASTQDVCEALKAAADDSAVEDIILHINSPGGYLAGTEELADAIARAATIKPIIAQIEDLGASAAYWVASQATNIYAGNTDNIGSIGVIAAGYDFSKAYNDAGIRPVVVTTGNLKSAFFKGTEVTEEQQAALQRNVDVHFDSFRNAVMRGRGMTNEQFSMVGDGGVYNARDALAFGLIDAIQTMDKTLGKYRQKKRGRSTATARARLALAFT